MTAADVTVVALHAKALSAFDVVVEQVGADQWSLPTPCSEWDVRALVNHVLGEARWSAPLLAGSTIEEVGDRFDGDLLGADPLASWVAGREEAAAASAAPEVVERSVHLSFGLTPAEEYLRQLIADYLIHSWDLAVAIGADTRLDPELVDAVESWFVDRAAAYRAGGAVAAQVPTTAQDDPQRRLLGMFGRDTDTSWRWRQSPASAPHPTDETSR
jgi:uncharacterized protein (TIGR03086 family)